MNICIVLTAALAAVGGSVSSAVGQVSPGRQLPPSVNPSPTTLPPRGAIDPTLTAEPVRPGTIQRDPGPIGSRDLVYLAPGEAPSNVRVTGTGPRSVTLSWSPPAGVSNYWVFQAHAGDTTYYRNRSTTDTTCTVDFLLPGTTYSYKVSATYPQEVRRREGLSEAVSAMTAAAEAPSGFTAAVTGKAQVTLTWNKLAIADGYRVYRNGSVLADVKPVKLTMDGPPTLRTTYDDPAGPGTHEYQIQAVYGGGNGEVTSAVVPYPPVSVTIKASTRVRYCQTAQGRPACVDRSFTPAVIATNTAFRTVQGKAP